MNQDLNTHIKGGSLTPRGPGSIVRERGGGRGRERYVYTDTFSVTTYT